MSLPSLLTAACALFSGAIDIPCVCTVTIPVPLQIDVFNSASVSCSFNTYSWSNSFEAPDVSATPSLFEYQPVTSSTQPWSFC